MDLNLENGLEQEEKGFVETHFHEYPCEFDEEPGQQNQFEGLKVCMCGRLRCDHVGKRHFDSGCCGSITTQIKKEIKYVQLCDKDNIYHLLNYMEQHWDMKKIGLILSVIGDKCPETAGIRRAFTSKLIQATRDTQGMIITSGFKDGVALNVDVAFSKQGFYKRNQGIRVMSVVPWRGINNRTAFQFIIGKKSRNFVKMKDVRTQGGTELCDSHTHFVFVDKKPEKKWDENVYRPYTFRHNLEVVLSAAKTYTDGCHLSSPVVVILVGGGVYDLEYVCESVSKKLPVIVCCNTGGLANVFSHSGNTTDSTAVNDWIQNEKQRANFSTDKVLQQISLARNSAYLRLCDITKGDDFEQQILSALLDKVNPIDIDERLCVAVGWGMLENDDVRKILADKELINQGIVFTKSLLEAILKKDRMRWIEYYLDLESPLVDFREFITNNLQTLYKRATEQVTPWEKLAKGQELHNLRVITKALKKFTDGAYSNTVGKDSLYLYPYKELLMWAILCDRPMIARFALEKCEEPIECAIAVSRILHYFSQKIPPGDEGSIVSQKRYFEEFAVSILQNCFDQDRLRAKTLLYRKSKMWSGQTVLEMASNAYDTHFMMSPIVTKHVDEVWEGGLVASKKKKFILVLFPFLLLTPLLRTRHSQYLTLGRHIPERPNKNRLYQLLLKTYLFYTAPVTKFCYHTLTHIMFLFLFSYMALVDFRADYVTVTEYICSYWIHTLLLDEVYTVLYLPSKSLLVTMRNRYNALRVLQIFNQALCLLAFYIHLLNGQYGYTKVMYALCLAGFYLELIEVFAANRELGPKSVMMKYMIVKHLSLFMFMMLIFLLAYGTSHQVVLYVQREASWDILREIFYTPYWNMFGDLNLSDLATDTACTHEDKRFCREEHLLAYILLAIYLLMGNVLLLNLLIAIFNNVYTAIDHESLAVWRYNMHGLAIEYLTKTVFVPPFSALVQIYFIPKKILENCLVYDFCTSCKYEPQSDLEDMRVFLDQMEKDGRTLYLDNEEKDKQLKVNEKINELSKKLDAVLNAIGQRKASTSQPSEDVKTDNKKHDKLNSTIAISGGTAISLPNINEVDRNKLKSTTTYASFVDDDADNWSYQGNGILNGSQDGSVSEERENRHTRKPRVIKQYLSNLVQNISTGIRVKHKLFEGTNEFYKDRGIDYRSSLKKRKKKRKRAQQRLAALDKEIEDKSDDIFSDDPAPKLRSRRDRQRQVQPLDIDTKYASS